MRDMYYDFDSSSVVFKSINMKQFYLLLIFLLLLSCNKQTDTSVKTIKAKAVIIPKIKVDGNAIEIDSAVVLSFENQKLLEFYRATGFKTVWQSAILRKVVLKAIKDVYSSSRISDDGIIQVRESVNKLILELQSNRRDATVSSFRIAFVLYIIILSFKYLK